jgi:hypothetical protein
MTRIAFCVSKKTEIEKYSEGVRSRLSDKPQHHWTFRGACMHCSLHF